MNKDRIRIQLEANQFMLLWCIEIKNKEEKQKFP